MELPHSYSYTIAHQQYMQCASARISDKYHWLALEKVFFFSLFTIHWIILLLCALLSWFLWPVSYDLYMFLNIKRIAFVCRSAISCSWFLEQALFVFYWNKKSYKQRKKSHLTFRCRMFSVGFSSSLDINIYTSLICVNHHMLIYFSILISVLQICGSFA